MSETRKQRVTAEGALALKFPPHVKFRFDEVRQAWVVLAPERLMLPDAQAVEILKSIDGTKTVDGIIDELAARYAAPREIIATDVLALFQDLLDKGVLRSS